MTRPDILRTTFEQSPHMSEATQNMAVGDKATLEVRATFKARDAEGIDWTVEAVVPEGYEVDEDATEPQTQSGVSGSDAMMTPTSMMVKRKAGAKA